MKSRIIFKKLICIILFAMTSLIYGQVYVPEYGNIVDQCSESGILTNLTAFENLGVKYRGTTAQANTLNWLKDKYASYGYLTSQVQEDPYTYSNTACKNLIVTKIGTLYPNTFVIIDAHYDTVNGPGANDNGSGTVLLLEIARLLVDVPTEYSIRFIHFSGEEDGLKGSNHYVNDVVNATNPKMNIRLVFNIDQVGGVAGANNNAIVCERDLSSPSSNNTASNTMTNQLMACVGLYSTLTPTLSNAYSSDYVPFENNNEVITGFYEANESTHTHSASDLLINMDPNYVYKVTKAAIGAALHFAVACTNCNLGLAENTSDDFNVKLYPNPAKDSITIDKGKLDKGYIFSVVDMNGKTLTTQTFDNPKQSETLPLTGMATGIYSVIIESQAKRIVKKISIE